MKLEHFTELYKSESPDDVSAYKINFGKHKNRSFKWIYENDKSYVVFLIKKLNYETNTIMLDYFKEMIEQEAEPDENKLVEKKQRKPRTKKTDEIKELFVITDDE
jgi:hypothetical protein